MIRHATGTQTMVSNLLKAVETPMRVCEIRDTIGLSGSKGAGRVNNALRDLVRRKEVKRTHYGRYQWVGEAPKDHQCKKQRILWRYMWFRSKKRKPFTVRKVHEMTGVSLYTTKHYVTYLSRSGFLVKVGRKKSKTTYANLYIVDEARMQIAAPTMQKRQKTIEVESEMDKCRKLAATFFTVAKIEAETIKNLQEAVQEIGKILESCEAMIQAEGTKNRESQPVESVLNGDIQDFSQNDQDSGTEPCSDPI